MMKIKFRKLICYACVAVFCLLSFGCSEKGGNVDKNADELAAAATTLSLPYSTGLKDDGTYDNSAFYRNDGDFDNAADPVAFYNEDDGYFYIYVTAAPMCIYKTKNFSGYEWVGYIFENGYNPLTTWASHSSNWAPRIIKYRGDDERFKGKFLMYFGARSREDLDELDPTDKKSYNDKWLSGLAVADTPSGPFRLWTGTREMKKFDDSGRYVGRKRTETVTETTPIIAFNEGPEIQRIFGEQGVIMTVIDSCPFYDDNGDMYLYTVIQNVDDTRTDPDDKSTRRVSGPCIFGVRMLDPVTPDLDTLVQLTKPYYKTVDGNEKHELSEKPGMVGIDEGGYVQSHTTVRPDGTKVKKYYLTFSPGGYYSIYYPVTAAVADDPLGPYVKLDEDEGQPIVTINNDMGEKISGTGIGSFVEAHGETYVFYHRHKDYGEPEPRTIAVDRVLWRYYPELGYEVPHCNGPTSTLQPNPATADGYRNVAAEAVAEATNGANSAGYLNDGYVAIHDRDENIIFRTKGGKTTITLTFAEEKEIHAVAIYNDRNIDYAFGKVDYILFENAAATYKIEDLVFPEEYGSTLYGSVIPGAAITAVFRPLKVKKITIRISRSLSEEDDENAVIGISDVFVAGK